MKEIGTVMKRGMARCVTIRVGKNTTIAGVQEVLAFTFLEAAFAFFEVAFSLLSM